MNWLTTKLVNLNQSRINITSQMFRKTIYRKIKFIKWDLPSIIWLWMNLFTTSHIITEEVLKKIYN